MIFVIDFYKRCYLESTLHDRVMLCVSFVFVPLMLFFTYLRCAEASYGVATTDFICALGMFITHVLTITNHAKMARAIFVTTYVSGAVAVVVLGGHQQLNWIYPMSAFLYFSVRPSRAIIINLVILVVLALFLIQQISLVRWAADIISLGLSVFVISVFALQSRRQQQRITEESNEHRLKASIDSLTNIYNRSSFDEMMTLLTSHENEKNHVLILIDLDYFKRINDTFGHDVGDAVLQKTVHIMQGELRESELIYRVGGEEFAVLLPDTLLDNGIGCAERMRKAVEATFENCDSIYGDARVTISAGLAALNGNDKKTWYKLSDQALYRAKREGRNKVCF